MCEQLKIRLTDAVTRHLPEGVVVNTSMSKNGNLIYAVYVGSPRENVAELFQNKNGQLQSILTLPLPKLPNNHVINIDDGRLNLEANKFTLLYTDVTAKIAYVEEYEIVSL